MAISERASLYSMTPSALPFVSVFPETDVVDASTIEREKFSRKCRQNRWLTGSPGGFHESPPPVERLPTSPETGPESRPESDFDSPREKSHRKPKQSRRLSSCNQTTCESKSTDKDADKARILSKRRFSGPVPVRVPVSKDTQKAFVTRMSRAKQRANCTHVCYHHKNRATHPAPFRNRFNHAKFLRKRQQIRTSRSPPISPTSCCSRSQILETTNSRYSYFIKCTAADRDCQVAQVCSKNGYTECRLCALMLVINFTGKVYQVWFSSGAFWFFSGAREEGGTKARACQALCALAKN